MMDGWTEFDMVRVENELKDARLYREAMLPKLIKRHPVRLTLARVHVFLTNRLLTEHLSSESEPNQSVGISEV